MLGPILFALLVTAVQTYRTPTSKIPELDDFYYFFIARDLKLYGVFSDGLFRDAKDYFIAPDVREEHADVKPGRFFTPAYPFFLHLLQTFDSGLAKSIRCHCFYKEVEPPPCPNDFGRLVAIQVVLAALAAFCAFVIGIELSGSQRIAWLTLALVLATGELGSYPRTYLSENLSLPAFCAFMTFAVLAASRLAGRWFLAAGVSLSLATLVRPGYLYLLAALVLVLLLAPLLWPYLKRKQPLAWGLREAALFAAGGALLLVPWLIRNRVLFGDFELTHGYAGYALVQRLAYNLMSWPEWLAAFIVWLPGFGDELGKLLLPERLYERLGFFDANTYYQIGWNAFRTNTLAAAGSVEAHLGYLIRNYIVGDLVKHTIVTLPLAMRGFWAGKYLALVALALAWPVLRDLWRTGNIGLFAVLSLPPLFMVGFHAFVSVSIDRYNLPMIIVFAFIIASYVDDRFIQPYLERRASSPAA